MSVQTRRTFLIRLSTSTVLSARALSSSARATGMRTGMQGRVTFMAVGDIMMHAPMIRDGFDPEKGTYDFSPYFEYVTPLLRRADWVFGNLETRLAGADVKIRTQKGNVHGYTGYAFFNAPEQLSRDLKRAGFTLLSTANNHCLDRSLEGISRTNETLEAAGLMQTGTFASPEDRDSVRILVKNGISMAVFAYTYGTNGIPLPPGREYLVNLIDPDLIGADIERARKLGVDLIACSVHFEGEYQRFPNEKQLALSETILALGADIILGHHSHVVQPYQVLQVPGGSKKAALYSMGNFISNQTGRDTDLGVIFRIDIEKHPPRKAVITSITPLPTRVYRARYGTRKRWLVLPVREVLERGDASGLPSSLLKELEQQLPYLEDHLASMMQTSKG